MSISLLRRFRLPTSHSLRSLRRLSTLMDSHAPAAAHGAPAFDMSSIAAELASEHALVDNDRPYLYAGVGRARSAEAAAYHMAIQAEHARGLDLSIAATLTDLQKAYENVLHPWLVSEAETYGFPMHLLSLALGLFRGGRYVSYLGAISGPIFVGRTIVAGISFSGN